ncbi:SURF1 family cytochrome oxidase biogenesis protein [Terrabacter sp. 2RAF25]|uniref:SURF1 family cytochrome oxidase biogenesis protein n=1 Tax=Terrabacter sp. 2RAF25 TaxID=3232998 RepID=UPI003F9585AF
MLRLWLTRRWLLGTLVAVLFGVACFYLGLWQWHRHVEQRTKVDAIARNYGASPIAFSPGLVGTGLPQERQWTRVSLTGAYAAGTDLLVRNRTLDQTVGFEVLTPFQADGVTILVDRGWVPNAEDAETSPPVDPPPSGTVELTGWLRTGEVSLGRDLPRPQLASINVADARVQVPALGDLDAYVVLGTQAPAPSTGGHPVRVLPRPEEDLGPHQAYAYQWWLFMPGGLVFVVLAIRREAEAAREENEPTGSRPAKPKKVRIWDEEDA